MFDVADRSAAADYQVGRRTGGAGEINIQRLPLDAAADDRSRQDRLRRLRRAGGCHRIEPSYSDIEWELAIFEDNQVNAFAMPGGKIGVYTGILEVTEDEHQLAAVIGHEIAHVTARHVNERASRGALTGIGIEALAVIMGGGYTGGAYTASQVLGAGAALGMELPMGRGQESEADVVGLEYMAKAGFDPRAAVDLWQNMAAMGGKKPPEHLSTHPASETRIENLINQWQKTLPIYNEALAEGKNPQCKKTW